MVDDGRKLITLLLLVAITGVIGLRSPIMLVAVPTLIWRLWSSNDGYWGHTWHYSAVLMPIAFAAMLDGIQQAGASPRAWLRRAAVMAPAIAVTVAVVLAPQLDFKRLGRARRSGTRPRATSRRAGALDDPGRLVVDTDIGLMSYLVDRTDVFYVGNSNNPVPDYVLIDQFGGGWNPAPNDAAQYAQDRFPGTTFRIVYNAGGYQLAERIG